MKTPIEKTMEEIQRRPGTSGFPSEIVVYWSPVNGSIKIVEESPEKEFIGSFVPTRRCKQQKQLASCLGKLMNFLDIDELSAFTEELNKL